MKREVKVKSFLLISGIIGILLLSLVSAGWFDWVKKTITGYDTSRPTNVSVTVLGADMVSLVVHNGTLIDTVVDPTEEGYVNILFNVTVTDPNGATDINTSSVTARFVKVGEGTRVNTTGCTENAGQSTPTSKNFTCTISLAYFDAPGAWTINVSARDLGNSSINSSVRYNFTYDQLQSLKIDPSEVFWNSVISGATNQTAGNSTIINNTGNYNMTGNIGINATNLYSGANFLDVGNVSVGIAAGSECNGTFMVNAIDTTISGVVLERGNLTLGVSNDTIYYCLATVPTSLPSGTYDTTTEGSWTIKLV